MDFQWDPEIVDLCERTTSFAREQLNQGLAAREREARFHREGWSACGDFGLLGLSVPTELGGMGLDALNTARVVEAFGHGCEDGGLVFSALAHLFACVMPLVEHAEPSLAEELVPKLASGQLIGANAITEAEAGSDVFALRSTASEDGDDYVLNGAKSFVTNGPVADVFVFYATRDPGHGYMGVDGFVVMREQAGVRVGERFETVGLTTSPISSLYFDEVRVPKRNRLGGEGSGAAVFKSSMLWERACLFAAYVGSMQRQLDECVGYAKERRQFGKPIGKHQAIGHKLADMLLRLESARLLLYRACWTHGRTDATKEIALAKLAISESAILSSLDAIQLHGGAGIMRETGVERALRNALPGTIFSGTSEIQRDIIARALGL